MRTMVRGPARDAKLNELKARPRSLIRGGKTGGGIDMAQSGRVSV